MSLYDGMQRERDTAASRQRKQIRKLQAENAALKADRERLDWLAEMPHTRFDLVWAIVVRNLWGSKPAKYREAIDAARAEESDDG